MSSRLPEERTPPAAFKAVALVGLPEEHGNNRALLEAHGLKALLTPRVESLKELATSGLCGIVVGGSVWASASAGDHEKLLRELCGLSTLLFMRLSTRGLTGNVAKQLHEIHRERACGSVRASHFCQDDLGQLTSSDLAVLSAVASLQVEAASANYHPMGLAPAEAKLIGTVIAGRTETRASLQALRTKQLTGGRSSARLFLVAPNDGLAPIVFKIDAADALRKEILAYQKWLREWDDGKAAPEFHSHLSDAVLTYRLKASPDSSTTPAPTLEEQLGQLRGAEIWERDKDKTDRAFLDLETALKRTVAELGRLAARHATPVGTGDFWLPWSTTALAERGITSRIRDEDGADVDVPKLVEMAAKKVNELWGRAVNHGDIQARNVLLQDRIPAFIDFARSGPGHPCYDLVTFDGSVRHLLFRLLEDEGTVALFMKRLYCEGSEYEALLAEFPRLLSAPSNRLVTQAAVEARRTAINVLHTYGGALLDYLALTAIASAWMLAQLVCSSGVERGLLSALSKPLREGLAAHG